MSRSPPHLERSSVSTSFMYRLGGPCNAPGGSPNHLILRLRASTLCVAIYSYRVSSKTSTEAPHPFDKGSPPKSAFNSGRPNQRGAVLPPGETGAAPVVAVPLSDTPPSLTASGGDPLPKGGSFSRAHCRPTADRQASRRARDVWNRRGQVSPLPTSIFLSPTLVDLTSTPQRGQQAHRCRFARLRGPPHRYVVCHPLG